MTFVSGIYSHKPAANRVSATNGGLNLTVATIVQDVLGEIFVDSSTMEQLTGETLFSGMYARVQPGSEDVVEEEFKGSALVSEVKTRDNAKSGILELMAEFR